MPGLQRIIRQLEDIQTKLDLLEKACPPAQAELLSDWPSALQSPNLENELPRLHGMCQNPKARSHCFALMNHELRPASTPTSVHLFCFRAVHRSAKRSKRGAVKHQTSRNLMLCNSFSLLQMTFKCCVSSIKLLVVMSGRDCKMKLQNCKPALSSSYKSARISCAPMKQVRMQGKLCMLPVLMHVNITTAVGSVS